MSKMGMSRDNRMDYYRMMGVDNLQDLTVGLLEVILLTGDYKRLSYDTTRVLYRCLESHMTIKEARGKGLNVNSETFDIAIRDVDTGYYTTYYFGIDPLFTITTLDDMEYYKFFLYYIDEHLTQYFKQEVENPKIHTSPLMMNTIVTALMYRTMYWYMGEDKAKELIDYYIDGFFSLIKQSRYAKLYGEDVIEKARVKITEKLANETELTKRTKK